MTPRRFRIFALATAAALLGASPAWAFDPKDLQGKKLDKARDKLLEHGYSMVRSDTTRKRAYQYWWSARQKTCAFLVVDLKSRNERVVEATKVGKKECRSQG